MLLQFVKMLQRQQLNMAQTAQSLLKALSLKVTMQMQLHAVAQIAAGINPAALFTGATGKGKDLVPRIAAKLATGSVCDATAVKLDEAGNVVFTVPAYGGNILTDVVIDSVNQVGFHPWRFCS